MILDANFSFGLPAIANSNTPTASTNVFDAGSAKKIFQAGKGPKVWFRTPVSVDTTSVKIELVGSAAAALTSPYVIASKTITHDELGAALGAGTQNIEGSFEVREQEVAFRYYGLLVTLGGTNPDMTAGDAELVIDAANSMRGARAAVP